MNERPENILEKDLRFEFLRDVIIREVDRADFLHEIFNDGNKCGTILWEIKEASCFSKDWPRKLREHQIEVDALVAILVTDSLLTGAEKIKFVDGVYVVSPFFAIPFCMCVRSEILNLAKKTKIGLQREQVDYHLMSTIFKQKVTASLFWHKVRVETVRNEAKKVSRKTSRLKIVD